MQEIKLRGEQSFAKRQAAEPLTTMFPFGRSLGLSPFAWMREFAREMDRAFRGSAPAIDSEEWMPAVDIQQCNGTLVISAELPGLKREEVRVEVADDTVIIEGDRKREHKEDHEGFHRWERSYGHFYRSIPLPEGARTDQIKAQLSDGILKVSMPVAEIKKQIRQVAVDDGAKLSAA